MTNFLSGLAQTAVRAAPFAAQVLAQREAKEAADRQRQLAQLHQQNQDDIASMLANSRIGVDTATIGKTNAETTKIAAPLPAKKVYDPTRGVMVNETDGTFAPIAGLPDKPVPPKAPGNTDPLSDAGIAAAAKRAGAVAAAEAPFKKDPNVEAAPKATDFSNKAALLYQRAADAATRLSPFFESGAPVKAGMGKVPVVGNYVLSPNEQVMNQAAETVASAILRLESGAAISESEVKSYAKQFLPQPGDSPQVRADKKATLTTQLERIHEAARPSLHEGAAPVAPAGRGRGGPPPNAPRVPSADRGGDIDLRTGKTVSPDDAAKAKADPQFAAWLKSKGYQVP